MEVNEWNFSASSSFRTLCEGLVIQRGTGTHTRIPTGCQLDLTLNKAKVPFAKTSPVLVVVCLACVCVCTPVYVVGALVSCPSFHLLGLLCRPRMESPSRLPSCLMSSAPHRPLSSLPVRRRRLLSRRLCALCSTASLKSSASPSLPCATSLQMSAKSFLIRYNKLGS